MSLFRRELIAECDLEIVECHLVALPINKAEQGSCRVGDVTTRRSRTQRDQLCCKNKPQPLQPISDSLPARPHCGVSTTKFDCLTPSRLMMNQAVVLPALARVGHRRQAFSKLRLLALGIFLLVSFTRLLFRTGTRTGAAQQRDKKRRNQNRLGKQLFHTGDRETTIIRAINAATFGHRRRAGLFNFGDVVFVYRLLAIVVLEGS